MMCNPVTLLLVALTTALAAPPNIFENNPVIVPQKRAALVLDRLLMALQKALHEESSPQKSELTRDWPRTAPLRIDTNVGGDMKDIYEEVQPLSYEFPDRDVSAVPVRFANNEDNDLTGLQRRGQTGAGRGRVLRCYFNAVTCF